jgi:uncharacterized protein YjgD (DUF1641 family)
MKNEEPQQIKPGVEGVRISRETGIEIQSAEIRADSLAGLILEMLKDPKVQKVLGINETTKKESNYC